MRRIHATTSILSGLSIIPSVLAHSGEMHQTQTESATHLLGNPVIAAGLFLVGVGLAVFALKGGSVFED